MASYFDRGLGEQRGKSGPYFDFRTYKSDGDGDQVEPRAGGRELPDRFHVGEDGDEAERDHQLHAEDAVHFADETATNLQ